MAIALLWLDASVPDLWLEHPAPAAVPVGAADIAGPGATGGRVTTQLMLTGPDGAPIEAVVSRPLKNQARLPVIILIGGFDTGLRSVERVSEPGANVLIGYGYPDSVPLKSGGNPIRQLIVAQRSAQRVPGQIAALAEWAAAQPWADPHRMVLAGVSLGAILAPASAQAMAEAGIPPAATVLAYGGADLETLAGANLRRVPPLWQKPAAWAIAVALRRLEPARYLPGLKGAVLVIHAADDRFIPGQSAALLDRLAPASTTIVTLPGGHVLPGDEEVLAALNTTAKQWLVHAGAVN
jgi:dipeptidyl aminopeptidase/acylaminoacyl peptidase